MVVVGHLIPRLAALASAGVTVFFVLSGYLITSLVVRERQETGRVDLRRFYLRRACRLLPSLLLVLVVICAWSVSFGVYTDTLWSDALEVVLYVSNWGTAAGHFTVPLRMTWSLAIEEQFYLVWPLIVLVFAGRSRRLALVAAVAGFVSLTIRILLIGVGPLQVYYRSDSVAVLLLIGCAFACLDIENVSLRRLTGHWGTAPLVGGILLYEASWRYAPLSWTFALGLPILALCVAQTILFRPRSSWLSASPLIWLGGISYTLYLWQSPVLYNGLGHGDLGSMSPWGVIPIALPLAWLTSRYVERPVMRWGHRR